MTEEKFILQDDMQNRAQQILLTYWGIDHCPAWTNIGVNKQTWRVGRYWLSCARDHVAGEVKRELQLYVHLHTLEDSPGAVAVPYLVESTRGLFIHAFNHVWWVTEHVPGRQPDPRRPEDTLAIARGLANLHFWLRPLPPDLAVSTDDSIALFKRSLALVAESSNLKFSALDMMILQEASTLINTYLSRLSTSSLQLIHGDPSHPNLRLSEEPVPRLVGALDWESCRNDLPLSDLSTLGQTIVFRSGSLDPLADLTAMLDAYYQAGGERFDLTELLVFMLIGKFESIAHHGARFLRGEATQDLVLSQPEKIHTILDLLKSAGDSAIG